MAVIRWQPSDERLGDRLALELQSTQWSEAWFISAWAKLSGVLRLRPAVLEFTRAGHPIHALVGIDLRGTTSEALELLALDYTTARVYHNPGASSFHTKVYAFAAADRALVFVGSNNLTGGGLYTNVETDAEIQFDFSEPADKAAFDSLIATIEGLTDPRHSPVRDVDEALVAELLARGLVVPEASIPGSPSTGTGGAGDTAGGLFPHVPVPPPPPLPPNPLRPSPTSSAPTAAEGGATRPSPSGRGGAVPAAPVPPAAPIAPERSQVFVMTLGPRDTRQAAGYSRDVYIPLAAREAEPNFWQWPAGFARRGGTKGTYDERRVPVVLHAIGAAPLADDRRLFYYHEKSEFRFNAGSLIDGASPGDLIVFESATIPGAEYEVSVIKAGSPKYATWLAVAVNALPSGKRWGYA